MPFDPTFPGDHQELVGPPWRDQFNALKALIDDLQSQVTALQAQANGAALMPNLTILDVPFSNPPATADLEAIRTFVNTMGGQLQGGW